MKSRKRDGNGNAGDPGFASWCVGILLEVGAWVASTIFMTIGCALFIFGILSFAPEVTAATVFALIAVPVAAILFVRTGRAILRDLRNQK